MPESIPWWRALTLPAAKLDESTLRWLWSRLRPVLILMVLAIVGIAVAWARHDKGAAAVMQAADWLIRLPLALATFVIATVVWYLHVQVVDSLRLAKWSFQWALDKEEEPVIKAAKTLGWGIYQGLSWLGTCLIISKALGA